MCVKVYNRDTQKEAESPKELREMIDGDLTPANGYARISDDACLCQVDVEASCKTAGFEVFTMRDPFEIEIEKAKGEA